VDARLAKNTPGRNAAKDIAGSDVAAQEVMPGRTSGEVMLALARQEAEKKKSQRIRSSARATKNNSVW